MNARIRGGFDDLSGDSGLRGTEFRDFSALACSLVAYRSVRDLFFNEFDA